MNMHRLAVLFLINLCLILVHSPCLSGQEAAKDYQQLSMELDVRETGSLMFAKYSDDNLAKLEAFLKKYPSAVEREKVLYLKAHTIWSLHRYDKAPPAYAALIKEFPDGRFSRIARLREAAAYLFSGQPTKALPRLKSLQNDYPDRPEMYARELAYSLSRCGMQKEALGFMDLVEASLLASKKERLLPQIRSHFNMIRLIGKPIQDFAVKDHRTRREISPKTLRGKVVLVDFWATWCGPCIADLPFLVSAHEQSAANGFEIFSISLDEDETRYDKMVMDRKMNWLHFYDGNKWDNQLAKQFDIHSVPANLLVDRSGIIRNVNLRGNAIAAEVKTLLKEKQTIQVTLRNAEKYEFPTGMSGDEQGASITVPPEHAQVSTMVRNLDTQFEPVYTYQPKKDFVGKDSVEITLIDVRIGNAPGQEKTTRTKVLIKFNVIE